MSDIIGRYINYMEKKHGIMAAMVAGSYVTGEMTDRSDIDVFFIWPEAFKSMRGREYFEGQEFEYFISPEWKYYDRLRTDKTSMRIYASGSIVYDPDKKLERIKSTAIQKIEDYRENINDSSKKDYQFWLETIAADGIDLFEKKRYADFLYFTATNLQMMNDLLCKLKNKLPTYNKYGVAEMMAIDANYGESLQAFLLCQLDDINKPQLWSVLCNYLQNALGRQDITSYESVQAL